MTRGTLILRSLRFHARAHLGVVLGAAVGSATLVGALVVGDSVRGSLEKLALSRLGKVEVALVSGDRLFRARLADDIRTGEGPASAPVLELAGTVSAQDGSARANHAQILGVDGRFWKLADEPPGFDAIAADRVVLNEALARQLKSRAGDTVLLRVARPTLLSRDAPISPQEDYSVALRLVVQAVVSDAQFGRFSLQANQVAPFNAFVSLAALQEQTAQTNRANLLLCPASPDSKIPAEAAAPAQLKQAWQLADAALELRELPGDGGVELRSERIFLDPPVVEAAKKITADARPLTTYLVNELRVGDNSTPYSMVTAMGAPVVPPEMRDDEILINDWLAEDLGAKAGDTLSLVYYVIGNGRALEERTNSFWVRGIVPLAGVAGDPTLMPDFPGIAQAESTQNWDAGFPLQLGKIRSQDEKYWHEHHGTPKAFVTVAAGRRMWANRFGEFTAIRFPPGAGTLETLRSNLQSTLDPASVGLSFQRVREQALAASSQATDFGGLFIGFSFFLIVAALLLMALLFQFGLEQRAAEVGTLLALGFRPSEVRLLLLAEGALLALSGGIAGTAGGVFYAQAMLRGLTTVWRGAVGTSALQYHATPMTLLLGSIASSMVAAFTIWLTLRRQANRPARELLALGGEVQGQGSTLARRSWGRWVGLVAGGCALAMIGGAIWQRNTSSAETFFSAGALLLVVGLALVAAWLATMGRAPKAMTLGWLGLRASTRRRRRSLATVGLVACGVFLVTAVGAFRLDANADAARRPSGTGGFALIGQSALPVTYDLNGLAGRDFYGLNAGDLAGVSVVPLRVRDGDDASCLNLNRAQTPRLLGVNPQALQSRGAFTFVEAAKGLPEASGWSLLRNPGGTPADGIPAIGDDNSLQWALHKKVGDTVDYTDEQGRTFKLRLVASVANSILQGSLIIDEAEFVRRFPSESGYRMFLVDAPSNSVARVSATLTRALQDAGLELTPASRRLNEFNAVQNTYLDTFQLLGGLGLLLGSAGLGVVVLRNVQERRGELALLVAVGFRRRALRRLVLSEHGALLGCGLVVGAGAAAVAVLPALLAPGARLPFTSLAVTLGAVLVNGLVWAWLATRFALRGKLIEALRNN